MKKIFIAIFCFLTIFSSVVFFAGCSKTEEYDVVCTIYPQYDFCRRIAGDELKVKMLLPAGTDAHNYQLTISDKMTIKNSKMFVYIGGESESWVYDIIKSTDLSGVNCVKLMDYVDKIHIAEEHEHSHLVDDDDDFEYDEHICLSIKNAIIICEKITEKLCETFPDKKEAFNNNSAEYISELLELDTQYTEKLSNVSTRTMYFADRYPFAYLAEDYDLSCVTPYHGCSTDREITLAQKVEFKNAYQNSGAKGVFIIENGYVDLAENVTSEAGGKIFKVHSCQSVSKRELDEDKSYVDFMKENLSVLTEALS